MRLFTFQGEEVARQLLLNNFYEASTQKSRHYGLNDYSPDINQLGGKYPIWAFMLPTNYTEQDLFVGKLLEDNRCELKTDHESLNNKVYIELEVDDSHTKTAIVRNSNQCVKVIPFITIDMVVAIYRVTTRETDCFYQWHLDSSEFKVSSVHRQSYPDGFEPMSRRSYLNLQKSNIFS